MAQETPSLARVYLGWDGYNTSLARAVEPLTAEQLDFRPSDEVRSVGELVRHITMGRLNWFVRMNAPKSDELSALVPRWFTDNHGNRHIVEEAVSLERAELLRWLNLTWEMIEATLTGWNVSDLELTYRHTFMERTYAVSRQWTIWRILSHDIHHGGQLSMLLYLQGIEPLELGFLGGHLTEPPLATSA